MIDLSSLPAGRRYAVLGLGRSGRATVQALRAVKLPVWAWDDNEETRERLDAAGFDHLPSQQIVLTGGASQIPGLDGIATRVLGQRVRLGRPLRVQGLPQAATGAAFSSTVGLCLVAAHPQDEWWDFEIPAERYPARSLRRAMKWFKDNW